MDPGFGLWLASEKPRQVSLYDHSDSKFWPLDKPEEVYYEESTQALKVRGKRLLHARGDNEVLCFSVNRVDKRFGQSPWRSPSS
jgi:hypothetical protein